MNPRARVQEPRRNITCPFCSRDITPSIAVSHSGLSDREGYYSIEVLRCPNTECDRLSIWLQRFNNATENLGTIRIFPRGSSRPPAPREVVTEDSVLAQDYREACDVLEYSTKASAALSRRCLQHILHQKTPVQHGSLASEIQQVLASNALPPYITELIDVVRHIGNFAAHPMTSTTTGDIIEVERDEAETLLDVLEYLFDFYYVKPAASRARRQTTQAKLNDSSGGGKLR